MTEIQICSDKAELVNASATLFIKLAKQSIQQREQFLVALSGGSTPWPIYRALGNPENAKKINWSQIHLFFGDERYVPSNHEDSNFQMVSETLLNRVNIPNQNIHRVVTELDVNLAASVYEEELRAYFKGQWPRFDLVLLGMGEDGHTASLFPHSEGLKEEQRWFISNYVPKLEAWRLTLTKNAINHAHQIVVIVNGASKAATLAEVLTGSRQPLEKPIQEISPVDGKMTWLVDKAAAALLPESSKSATD